MSEARKTSAKASKLARRGGRIETLFAAAPIVAKPVASARTSEAVAVAAGSDALKAMVAAVAAGDSSAVASMATAPQRVKRARIDLSQVRFTPYRAHRRLLTRPRPANSTERRLRRRR